MSETKLCISGGGGKAKGQYLNTAALKPTTPLETSPPCLMKCVSRQKERTVQKGNFCFNKATQVVLSVRIMVGQNQRPSSL